MNGRWLSPGAVPAHTHTHTHGVTHIVSLETSNTLLVLVHVRGRYKSQTHTRTHSDTDAHTQPRRGSGSTQGQEQAETGCEANFGTNFFHRVARAFEGQDSAGIVYRQLPRKDASHIFPLLCRQIPGLRTLS